MNDLGLFKWGFKWLRTIIFQDEDIVASHDTTCRVTAFRASDWGNMYLFMDNHMHKYKKPRDVISGGYYGDLLKIYTWLIVSLFNAYIYIFLKIRLLIYKYVDTHFIYTH